MYKNYKKLTTFYLLTLPILVIQLYLLTSTSVNANTKRPSSDNYADLWQKIRSEFSLHLHRINHKSVDKQLAHYTKYKHYFAKSTKRSERYLYYIVKELEKRQMPLELALIPMIESAYNPYAYSKSHAAGLWQFIPTTGQHFGLKNNMWIDGRRDIAMSTHAALDYLQILHRRFNGDWLLAVAAYNAGGGTVSKAIRKNKKLNKPTDFWSLKLPKETQAYIPKLIALSKIIQNPKQYDLTLSIVPNQPYFAAVNTKSQLGLETAAELAGVSIDEINLLNPGYNWQVTNPKGPHRLFIPTKNVTTFKQNLAKTPKHKRIKWDHYTTQSNDDLSTLSAVLNCPVELLITINKLEENTSIINKTILLPRANDYAQMALKQLAKHNANINYVSINKATLSKIDKLNGFTKKQQLAQKNVSKSIEQARRDSGLVIWQSNY